MASVGAGEQGSGTPFSSRPFSDDTGHPCSVGQLLAWGKGGTDSSLLFLSQGQQQQPPKALLDMISFCYHSSPGKWFSLPKFTEKEIGSEEEKPQAVGAGWSWMGYRLPDL